MSSSSSTLRSMLGQEKLERNQWLWKTSCASAVANLGSLPPNSNRHNPAWRPYLAEWYLSVVNSVEEFDGDRGTFRRPVAHSAMKIMDIYLSRLTEEYAERARLDRRCYKTCAIACLYVAMDRSANQDEVRSNNDEEEEFGIEKRRARGTNEETNEEAVDGILVAGRIMPVPVFLRMCNSAQDIPPQEFVSTIASVRALLRGYDRFSRSKAPLVSAHFFDLFEEYVLENFPHAFYDSVYDGHDGFFLRAEAYADRALGDPRLADRAPSAVALGSLCAVVRDRSNVVDNGGAEDALAELIACYLRNGGCELPYLANVVQELRSSAMMMLEREEREWHYGNDDEDRVHVIPK